MRLILSGGTGFVGRNLILAAIRTGRYSTILAPVRDPEKLRRQLAEESLDTSTVRPLPWDAPLPDEPIDHAVHCAGILFARNLAAYREVNVTASQAFIRKLPPAARLVVLSSQSAGGPTPAHSSARSMTDPDAPITWYGSSKCEMEKMVRALRPDALILRPPMILGPRDQATLPLFRMAAQPIRVKPGIRPKHYSWIAASDLVDAILRVFEDPIWTQAAGRALYAAAPESISDIGLIAAAARALRKTGATLPLPHPLLRAASWFIDAVPALQASIPSLTRDRVREIFPNRWVLDTAPFQSLLPSGQLFASLETTLAETLAWYRARQQLPN